MSPRVPKLRQAAKDGSPHGVSAITPSAATASIPGDGAAELCPVDVFGLQRAVTAVIQPQSLLANDSAPDAAAVAASVIALAFPCAQEIALVVLAMAVSPVWVAVDALTFGLAPSRWRLERSLLTASITP